MEEMIAPGVGISEANVCNGVQEPSIGGASVDFPGINKKKEADKCEHFSIRRYVVGTRSKDWKICWPFSCSCEDEELKNQLPDVLPPLHIPKFKWWDCQKCLQSSVASDNAAVTSSTVLERICERRMYSVNISADVIGSEHCAVMHDHEKGKVAITVPDTGRDAEGSNNKNIAARRIDKKLKKKGKVIKGTENRVRKIARDNKQKEMICQKKADNEDLDSIASSRRRKFRPIEYSNDEDEYVHNLCDSHNAVHLAGPSHVSSYKKPQKFRLLSDILRKENYGVSTVVSKSKGFIDTGDVNSKNDRTSNQPLTLALYDQTNAKRVTEEKNKKRKPLQDEEHNLLLTRHSKNMTKSSHFCQRDVEENHFKSIVNNAKLIDDGGLADHKTMGRERDERVEGTSAYWGSKNKRGSLQKDGTSIKQTNVYQTQEGYSPVSLKHLPIACYSGNENNLGQAEASRKSTNYGTNRMGCESESLNDIPLEIVELLAKNRHERLNLEAKRACQISFRMSEKSETGKDFETVLKMQYKNFKKVQKNSTSNNSGVQFCGWDEDNLGRNWPISHSHGLTSHPSHQVISHPLEIPGADHFAWERQNGYGSEALSEQQCACTQKKTINFEKPAESTHSYTNRYMPATQLLELMDAGMCPRVPPTPPELITFPILKTDSCRQRSPLNCRTAGDLPYQDYGNLGSSTDPFLVQGHKNYALGSGIEESQAREKGKASTDNPVGIVEVGKKVGSPEPVNGNLATEMCHVNRNPADFTVPGPRNRFMIGSGELRRVKMAARRGRPRKRRVKLLDLKEDAQN